MGSAALVAPMKGLQQAHLDTTFDNPETLRYVEQIQKQKPFLLPPAMKKNMCWWIGDWLYRI
jgi:hypothetical protein